MPPRKPARGKAAVKKSSAKKGSTKNRPPAHTALSLFKKNMQSVHDTLGLYRGIQELKVGLETSWLLRGSVVFMISALDTYFHDRIKYGIGKAMQQGMSEALMRHRITIGDLDDWEQSRRKGNVLRNWIVEHLAAVPLQSPDRIAEYMRYIGVEQFWNKIEPDNSKRKKLLDELNLLIKRRNQIAHEGDRRSGRNTGKKLRDIGEPEVASSAKFIEDLITRADKVKA